MCMPHSKWHTMCQRENWMNNVVHMSDRPVQPDILNPPLLRLTSRKPLWLDLQPVDIKSRWRHNWRLDQVVNSHLVCNPTAGNRVLISLRNNGLCWTIFARNRDTAVPTEGNGDLQLSTNEHVSTPVQEQYTDYVCPWGPSARHAWRMHSRGLPFYCPGQAGVC